MRTQPGLRTIKASTLPSAPTVPGPALPPRLSSNPGPTLPPRVPSNPGPATTSGPERAAPGPLDPPVEASGSRSRPSMTTSGPVRAAPGPLDPPVEASGSRARPATTTGPTRPVAPAPARTPSLPSTSTASILGLDVPPEPPPAAETPARPPLRLPSWLAPAIGGAVVVVALVAGVGSLVGGVVGGDVDVAAARRATDAWLAAPGGAGKVRSDAVASAVAAIGQGVAAPLQSRLGGRQVRVVVVDDESTTRAMTLPDATVVITTGMLRRLVDESQLAGIIAHGLAHVVNGDVDRAVARHRAAGVIAEAAGLAPGAPAPTTLVAALGDVANTTFSASEERAADDVMMEALAASGWSTGGLSAAIADLSAKGARKRAAWLVQHPESGDRAEARARARKDGRVNAPEFASRIRGPLDRPAPPTTTTPTTTPSTTR
jgi:hypothetical protein